MPDGAMRRGTWRRTHASAIRSVERLAKALSNNLLVIDVYSSMLVIGGMFAEDKKEESHSRAVQVDRCRASHWLGETPSGLGGSYQDEYRGHKVQERYDHENGANLDDC